MINKYDKNNIYLKKTTNIIQMHATYTHGFDLKSQKDITTNDFARLCYSLNKKFGVGYEFRPEPISEGGIIMKNFPNKKDKMYKTMRIYINRNHSDDYPIIEDDTLEKWEKEEGVKLISSNRRIGTFLKAFHGAPSWTLDELRLFKECFEEIGLIKTGRFPTKKSLTIKKGQYSFY